MERIAIHKQHCETRNTSMYIPQITGLGQQVRKFEDTFSGFKLLRNTFLS